LAEGNRLPKKPSATTKGGKMSVVKKIEKVLKKVTGGIGNPRRRSDRMRKNGVLWKTSCTRKTQKLLPRNVGARAQEEKIGSDEKELRKWAVRRHGKNGRRATQETALERRDKRGKAQSPCG